MSRKAGRDGEVDIATRNFDRARGTLQQHPLFAPLFWRARIVRQDGNGCPEGAWAVVDADGTIFAHPRRRGEPEEWVYVLAHCLLHLGFGHFRSDADLRPREWNAACDVTVERFLAALKFGHRPPQFSIDVPEQGGSEDSLYEQFRRSGLPEQYAPDMITDGAHPRRHSYHAVDWQALFAHGLGEAVGSAVSVAAGDEEYLGARRSLRSAARRARDWFVNSYPLLGALAAAFTLIEDPEVCRRLGVTIAAVDAVVREIYLNPAAALDEHEARFVIAHELLHVGLRHDTRRQGRDPFLWNVACDYVINGWLVEMGVGQLPAAGALYDPELRGESAEAVYDRIARDLRRHRKLATLRGIALGDMLDGTASGWWRSAEAVDLDEFYRRCLAEGLAYHDSVGRGLLPAGLIEKIRALSQPPIPWDVELARWFDHHFPPIESVHSYARLSRRQSSTPDIPRPRWVRDPFWAEGRTFGVLLDTSGSMDRALLAKALGAIASYSLSRDVPAARVVFCDAVTYDQGYMPPEAIADRVQVRGRGGTVLQPGVDLLQNAKDFPEDGPLLIITDGYCDNLRISREHAFLLPEGRTLPFPPRGPVFRIR